MSIPYQSQGSTVWNNTRVNSFWIDYPFSDRVASGGPKIYRMRCVCPVEQYATILFTATMANAVSAGVIDLPFTSDATAYHIGDTGHTYLDGGLVSFTRSFAPVPTGFDIYDGIVVSMPKAYDDGTNDVLFKGGPTEMPARFAYAFNRTLGSLTRSPAFQVTFNTYEVDWVRDTPNASDPTRTAFYSSTDRVAQPTDVSIWYGDIYVGITAYIKPEDAY